jgi:hypothetical protein
MPKYLSIMLSPNLEKTPEGYLICRNVPICRSGFQDYYGRELKGFPGYQDSWGLDPETKYSVHRPKEEVLHPDTIASFNGKTVVDEHPDGSVVIVENEGELNCGHIQDVGEGEPVDIDGKKEVTLKGDLHIKDPTLIEKVYPPGDPESGIRDVSCGYALMLKRLADGTLVMYHIRGNHVAVVSKGRAGSRIAIQDSAPPEIKTEKRKPIMNLMDLILGRGIKAMVPDASPEEISAITKDLAGNKVTIIPAAVAVDRAAVDKKPHHEAAHACLQRLLDAKGSKDGMGCDADGKPANLEALKKELNRYLSEEEKEPEHNPGKDAKEDDGEKKETLEELEEKDDKDDKDDPEKNPEKTVAEEEGGEDGAADADEIDDAGESVLKQANDSIREYIKNTKPLAAIIIQKPKSKWNATEKIMVDSYNSAVKAVNGAAKTGAYASFAKVKTPPGIPALSMVATDHAVVKVESGHNCTCFDGVPFAKGKRIHEAALLAEKGSK